MLEIVSSSDFDIWFENLKDHAGKAKIRIRIDRLALNNPGQVRSVGSGISELKIDFGPGYRVYYKKIGLMVVLLLLGGDKSTQAQDIVRAKDIAKHWS